MDPDPQHCLQEGGPVDLEAEGHDLAAQRVAAKQRLHAVGDLHLAVEHVPEQRRQQVLGVEQGHKDARQLVHLIGGDDVGQRDGNGQLALVADHGDQLDQLFETIRENCLGQGVELRALLQDLGEDLHEGGPGLEVLVVAEADAVHEAGVDVGGEKVGHGLDGGVA